MVLLFTVTIVLRLNFLKPLLLASAPLSRWLFRLRAPDPLITKAFVANALNPLPLSGLYSTFTGWFTAPVDTPAALEGCPVRDAGRNLRGVRRPAGFVYDGRGAGLNFPSPESTLVAADADPEPTGGFLKELLVDAIGLGREAILIV